MGDLAELMSFLSFESRLDVKCTALEYVLGLTGSDAGKEWVKSNKDIVGKLLDLMKDQNEVISKDAHLAIVNLSADEGIVDSLLSSIPQFLYYLQNPQWIHADKVCTTLSNISRFEVGARCLFKVLTEAAENSSGNMTFYLMVDIFDQWRSYNNCANFHYLASVFLNLSQIHEARKLFLDQKKCILPKLLPYTQFAGSNIRRGGIAGLIKNLCFEVGKQTSPERRTVNFVIVTRLSQVAVE